jgi:CheY-like chemotaxis protein
VRATVRDDLETLGFDVLEADGVEEAQRLCAGHRGVLDLLVSDVLLPTMPGPELAQRVQRLRPEIRVLFMSATPERAGVDVPVLRKPFDIAELAAAIERVLGAEATIGRIAAPTRARPPEPRPPTTERAAGAKTILLVEDEPTSRMAIADVLETDGFAVVVAATVQQALDIASSRHIDVLLTDVNLPDGSGEALVEQLRGADPDLRVIFMSGATNPPKGGDHFMSKPIELDDLLEVAHALAARR